MMKFGIVGNQCAGKTTVAKMISNLTPDKCDVVKFADPIYDTLSALGQSKNRLFMQQFSDLAKEHFGDDVFVNRFEIEIEADEKLKYCETIICDDCRYPFEFELLKKHDFTTIGILSPREVRVERAKSLGIQFIENHSSEQYVDELIEGCDYIIQNNGCDGYHLQDMVEKIMVDIVRGY